MIASFCHKIVDSQT